MKHIVVIAGSVRPGNYTMRAVRFLNDELEKRKPLLTYEIIDPASLTLPLPGLSYENSSHETLQEKVKSATGIIIASPEYHGGISSVMKLIIDNLGFPSVLATKPIALLGVAAGSIGAIKSLEQIRSICSHVGAIVLPGPVSVANVQHLFDEAGNCLDPEAEQRIRGVVSRLVDYIDNHICPKIALENMVREEREGI
ncbi:MAG: NAD(P)H-dependent oxidoreductase [Chlamydiales bacterium]|nr:NAD(P)H-dependent oxidoreductase [Chlamydiales bacterium]